MRGVGPGQQLLTNSETGIKEAGGSLYHGLYPREEEEHSAQRFLSPSLLRRLGALCAEVSLFLLGRLGALCAEVFLLRLREAGSTLRRGLYSLPRGGWEYSAQRYLLSLGRLDTSAQRYLSLLREAGYTSAQSAPLSP